MDKSKAAVSFFNKQAKEYQSRFMDVSLYHSALDLFCTALPAPGAKVLDVACGPGNVTKYLLTKRPDFKIAGIDLAPQMIELAQQANPSATFEVMDARNLLAIKQQVDAIVCSFCFPYLDKDEVLRFIENASIQLNPEGLLYLSTMEDNYSASGLRKGSKGEEMFVHFYLATDLTKMLAEKGFKLITEQRIHTVGADGSAICDLVLIARKKNSLL